MADIDIDPFGEHGRTEEPKDEHIPLDSVTPGVGGSTWEPEHEQETSFRGGESQRTKLMKDYVNKLYKKLSESYLKPQKHFTMIISNTKMGNCTTKTRASP